MGVRKKGRRKIVCNNQEYVWYVALDDDSVYYILNIRSEDKSLILSYPIKTRTSYIISMGRVFQGKKTDGVWHRYRLPFEGVDIVTPEFVADIIA